MASPLEILRAHWGHNEFRPLQAEIIDAVLAGKDTLALLPTGGGKSICFQVPGMAMEGLTIVISPLIALMRDQVENLKERGIPATAINSSLGYQEIDTRLQAAMDGKYKFLYLAPERIATDLFMDRLPAMNVELIAIDEAHCISQWGYDFRPAYLKIAEIRKALPKVPMIALTASATLRVREDIVAQLKMAEPAIFTKSFRRENLQYQVVETDDVFGRIAATINAAEGSGIVYARTRKATIKLAEALEKQGISAAAYHGGMPHHQRTEIQDKWLSNDVKVITATNAFGMGIDKPDVRFVMHYQLPLDLESYYQEAGRAGRDGLHAHAVAFVNGPERDAVRQWSEQKYPTFEAVKRHYESLCNYFGIPNTGIPTQLYKLDLVDLAVKFNHSPMLLFNSIRLLDREELISLNERPDNYGWVKFIVAPREVARFKERIPALENLVDFMLRTLGGDSYWEHMRFLPGRWANLLGIQPNKLENQLGHLRQHKIISYRPPVDMPTIRFLRPRIVISKNELNWDKYEFLTQQQKNRLAALLVYARTPGERCRSLIIESYFGEKNPAKCGICDVCRANQEQNPQQLSNYMQREIRDLLAAGPQAYRDVLLAMKSGTEMQRKAMIQEMLDKHTLEKTNDFRLKWVGTK